MRFKINRYAIEFDELRSKNPRLWGLLTNIDNFCQLEMGKQITITRIFSTKEEEDALYVSDMSKRPHLSPHEVWQAADLRSSDFTDEEIRRILQYCNTNYKYHDGSHPVAMYHKVSDSVYHFHTQYV